MSEEYKPVKEKTPLKIRVSTLFTLFFLLLLIALGVSTYYFYMEKEKAVSNYDSISDQLETLTKSVNDLKKSVKEIDITPKDTTPISKKEDTKPAATAKDVVEKQTSTDKKIAETPEVKETTVAEKIKDIVLEGEYAEPNTDYSYNFTAPNIVSLEGNIESEVGTYKTISQDTIEVTLTKKVISNIDVNPIEKTEQSYNEVFQVKVIDEKTIEITRKGNTFTINKIK